MAYMRTKFLNSHSNLIYAAKCHLFSSVRPREMVTVITWMPQDREEEPTCTFPGPSEQLTNQGSHSYSPGKREWGDGTRDRRVMQVNTQPFHLEPYSCGEGWLKPQPLQKREHCLLYVPILKNTKVNANFLTAKSNEPFTVLMEFDWLAEFETPNDSLILLKYFFS